MSSFPFDLNEEHKMNEQSKVWLNGKLIPWREATVPILSHGFSRGSAIFEVLGTYVGPQGTVAFRLDEHLKRLMKYGRCQVLTFDITS
jgi:branched-chain amino acid aminotransferase